MKNVVAPQAQILWDVGNGALNDIGEVDASKLRDADWDKLIAAARKLKAESEALAADGKIIVAAPDQKIQDEGNPGASSATQVQGFIDADRSGFADLARTMAASADGFVTASSARDGAKLGKVLNELDQVCEACHVRYWYPQQGAIQ